MPNKVVSVVCSDIHFSHSPPVSRSLESDWYEAQSRIIKQVRAICQEHECPLLIAGDLNDRWNCNSELTNFIIREFQDFPSIVAVPGQHDLPMHNYEDVRKSTYWTLVMSGVIVDVSAGVCKSVALSGDGFVTVWGFPWGTNLVPLSDKEKFGNLNVALVHRYVWIQGSGYQDAPVELHLSRFADSCKGYDLVVTGDNHCRFVASYPGGRLYNCGCLIPRKIDEKSQIPAVGLVYEDGKVESHLLDVSLDVWLDREEATRQEFRCEQLDRFLGELKCADYENLDFVSEVKRYLENPDNGVSDSTKRCLLEVLEGD